MGRQVIFDFVEKLAGVCGAEHVRVEEGVTRVAPATTEEVAAVLRYAHANGIDSPEQRNWTWSAKS